MAVRPSEDGGHTIDCAVWPERGNALDVDQRGTEVAFRVRANGTWTAAYITADDLGVVLSACHTAIAESARRKQNAASAPKPPPLSSSAMGDRVRDFALRSTVPFTAGDAAKACRVSYGTAYTHLRDMQVQGEMVSENVCGSRGAPRRMWSRPIGGSQ